MTPENDPLAAVRALSLPGATLTSLERDTSPTLTAPDGRVIENLPPRTIVKLELRPATGSRIQVEVWLPDAPQWKGRFLGLGNGGAAGNINPASLTWPLVAGYAVATTDLGTAPNSDSGIGNKEVWRDFGYRATHLMTVAGKAVVTAFYGRPPEYAYFNGGSTGGQQAVQEAQRYPEDYDGIVAAIPAHCRAPLHAYFLWNEQILKACPFTEGQEASVIAAGNQFMAAREVPAVAGKFVSDPRVSAQEVEAVIALARQLDATLTDAHAAALRKLLTGPVHAVTGERVYGGIPLGSSLAKAQGHLYLFRWVFGAEVDLMGLDFGADLETYLAALGPYLNAHDPDLSAFAARGGKLIMTVGTADSVVPYHASIEYYERVIAHFGGLDAVRGFFHFYVIPGLAHSGGPGLSNVPNMLGAVQAWREEGKVPHGLVGRRIVEGVTELEMPLYPYPEKTTWSVEKARYQPVEGARGGVDRIPDRFLPDAAE